MEALELTASDRVEGEVARAQRVRDDIVAAGARPRRLELTGVESLTPSERRISTMASEKLSNPEIAQALFLTRRTVEMHPAFVARGLTDAQIVERLERLERSVKLLAERSGVDFVEAQKVVAGL